MGYYCCVSHQHKWLLCSKVCQLSIALSNCLRELAVSPMIWKQGSYILMSNRCAFSDKLHGVYSFSSSGHQFVLFKMLRMKLPVMFVAMTPTFQSMWTVSYLELVLLDCVHCHFSFCAQLQISKKSSLWSVWPVSVQLQCFYPSLIRELILSNYSNCLYF